MRHNKGRWESYALIDGLPDVNVLAILEDGEGYLWFGTEDGGVSRYDGQSFVNFAAEDGLGGDRVRFILEGDFYDYLWLGENVGIVLADVSGKSVRAAMVAAMANGMLHTEIKGQREIWDSPGMILQELNIALQPRLIPSMFTAMSLGILQPEEGRLLFSNAGMPYPIVKRGTKTWELEVNGLPLGIMDGAEYANLGIDLEAADFVVFYSDGVSEASNRAGEIYRSERLLEVLQKADPDLSAQEMVDWIVRSVTRFVRDVSPSDDITVVVLECKGGSRQIPIDF